jgi:uncharacterized protein (TIGR03435 family)
MRAFKLLHAGALACAVAALAAALQLPAQPPSAPLRFKGVLIKPCEMAGSAGRRPPPLGVSEHALTIGCAELSTLVAYAYEVPRERVTGPEWIAGSGAPRFDVQADFPADAKDYQIPEMLRSLLAERFHLAAHRGTRKESVDCLVVTAGGLRLSPAGEPDVSISIGRAAAQAGGSGEAKFMNGIITWVAHPPVGARLLAPGQHVEYISSLTNWRAGTAAFANLALGRFADVRLQASSTTTKGITDLLVAAVVSPEVEDLTQTNGRFKFDIKVRLSETTGPTSIPMSVRSLAEGAPNAFHEERLKEYNKALAPLGLHVGPRTVPVELVIVDSADRAPADK